MREFRPSRGLRRAERSRGAVVSAGTAGHSRGPVKPWPSVNSDALETQVSLLYVLTIVLSGPLHQQFPPPNTSHQSPYHLSSSAFLSSCNLKKINRIKYNQFPNNFIILKLENTIFPLDFLKLIPC